MEKRRAESFGDAYELVSNSQDIKATLESVGMDYYPHDTSSLFVLVGDAEILEVWASNHSVPYNWATYMKIYAEGESIDMEAKEHYIVLVGMPGYLPDALYPAETKGQAIEIAKGEKEAYLDMEELRVVGNIRKDLQYDVIREGIYGPYVWMQITIEKEYYTDYEWELMLEGDI